jgi:hypothetical protein
MSYVAFHASTMRDVQLHRRLSHFGHYLLDFFGSCALRDISPSKLEKFTYHLEALGLHVKEIEACLVSFRACVKHAMQKQWDINPALLKPTVLVDGFQTEVTQLSAQEYNHLHQHLLQDLTSGMFH